MVDDLLFFLLIKNSCHNKINIGFIEFIVYPTMELCGDLIERVYEHLNSSSSSSSSTSTTVTATATTMATTSVDIIEEEEDNDDQKSSNDNEDDSILKPKQQQQQQISRNSSTTTTTINSSATVITTTTPVFNMVINSSTRKLYRPWLQYLDQNKTKWQQKATLEGILNDQTKKKQNNKIDINDDENHELKANSDLIHLF